MGGIEDLRVVLQDLVVPDLKALEQRVAALERTMEQRFAEVDRRFNEQERAAATRHAELVSYLSLEARVRKIEQEHVTKGH